MPSLKEMSDLLKRRDGLIARHRRVVLDECVDRLPIREIVKEDLRGDPCPREDVRAAVGSGSRVMAGLVLLGISVASAS
jgi:hypothetical protein